MEKIIFKEDTIDSLKEDIKERAELVFVKTGQPLIYNVNVLKNMAEKLANMLSEPTTEQQTSDSNCIIPVVSESLLDKIDELNTEGLGCGLEDVGITDRYEAMEYGFEQCIERVKEILS